MKYILIVSIIINIILLVLFYSIFTISDYNTRQIYKCITYKDIQKDIKSGDILLFSSYDYSLITRTCGHLVFSHIGIVVKYKQQLYSLELTHQESIYPNQKPTTGLVFIPLKDRITYYQGYVYLASLLTPLTKKQNIKLYNYSKQNYKFLDSLSFSSIFNSKSKSQICSQFIYNILKDLNIILSNDSERMWTYMRSIIKQCNNTLFSYPIQIISNDLLINKLSDNSIILVN